MSEELRAYVSSLKRTQITPECRDEILRLTEPEHTADCAYHVDQYDWECNCRRPQHAQRDGERTESQCQLEPPSPIVTDGCG